MTQVNVYKVLTLNIRVTLMNFVSFQSLFFFYKQVKKVQCDKGLSIFLASLYPYFPESQLSQILSVIWLVLGAPHHFLRLYRSQLLSTFSQPPHAPFALSNPTFHSSISGILLPLCVTSFISQESCGCVTFCCQMFMSSEVVNQRQPVQIC